MITIVIQAGGQSRRMGRDKALLPFLGQALIQRVFARLAPMADELIITTNNPKDYAFLNLPLFGDMRPGRGALGGLYTALACASHPLVAVVACDMPFVSPKLLTYQARLLEEEACDVAIPFTGNGYEPLHCVYRRESCLSAVEWALDHDAWRMVSWLARVKTRTLTADECGMFDPQRLAFCNINTPEECTAAEELARRMEHSSS